MLLLTGATGTIGAPLLRRLTAAGIPVRCLVRDPRRLGSDRVRVQIALGDLSDHLSFRHALRGVDTVVHLASVIRDQPGYSIEELAAVASWRLVRAAERAGVKRFVFFSALGASTRSPSRLLRAKAQAERVVRESELEHSIFAPSWVYSPDDRVSSILSRLAISPLVPFPGSGHARYQPIYAEDVADCVMAALALPALAERYELAGPETKELRQIVELILQARGRDRSLLGLPPALVRRPLKFAELLLGPAAPLTWEEAQLLTISAISQRADQDVLALGVTPRRIGSVYGLEP